MDDHVDALPQIGKRGTGSGRVGGEKDVGGFARVQPDHIARPASRLGESVRPLRNIPLPHRGACH
ncbi:MAG: hypothetical protein KJ551_03885 [Alphaproteobacteria bacterium]|nr:hypothetical protein [Alphaproteobacteria bacterium]